jgi:hypothetical protein
MFGRLASRDTWCVLHFGCFKYLRLRRLDLFTHEVVNGGILSSMIFMLVIAGDHEHIRAVRFGFSDTTFQICLHAAPPLRPLNL